MAIAGIRRVVGGNGGAWLFGAMLLASACATPTEPPAETSAKKAAKVPEFATPVPPPAAVVPTPFPEEASPNGPSLLRFAARPKAFNGALGESVELSFELGAEADVTVEIRDSGNRTVRRIELGRRPPGRLTAGWNGRNEEGQLLPPDTYLYAVRARDAAGRTSHYGNSAIDGGEEILVRRFTLDREAGRISYVMPRAGRVRLRAQLVDLPILRTLLDWEPQVAGPQELSWDGLDASSQIELLAHPDLRLQLFAFELPRNSILLEQSDVVPRRGVPGSRLPNSEFAHAGHRAETCHEPNFSVGFVDERGQLLPADKGTVPTLSKTGRVRIQLAPEDEAALINARFEVMVFVDTTFLFEEEEGSNPFNYELDVSRLNPGLHLLTINVLSYADHAGVVTLPFQVAP